MTPGLKKHLSPVLQKEVWIANVNKTTVARRFNEVGPDDLVFTQTEVELLKQLSHDQIKVVAQVKEIFSDADITAVVAL